MKIETPSTTFYKHYKKKEPTYQIIDAGEMQIDNVWHEAVIYRDIESKKVYVRQESDFNLKFNAI